MEFFRDQDQLPVHGHAEGLVRGVRRTDPRVARPARLPWPELRRGLHRRRHGRGQFPGAGRPRCACAAAWRPRASTKSRCRISALRATSLVRLPPDATQSAAEIRSRHREGGGWASTPRRGCSASRSSVPQIGAELQSSSFQALAFTRVLHLHLRRAALPHAAPVGGRDPRGAARPDPGARVLLADADDLRPGGGRRHPRRHRLFAERHRRRLRPHPRAFHGRTAARLRPRCWTNRSTRRCRARS